MSIIKQSINKLKNYIESNNFKGFDPYDALKSPLFKLYFFKSNKLVRFGSQQFMKRLPINLRNFLLVPKGLNPVTLGLSIQAYAYLTEKEPENKEKYNNKINLLLDQLIELIPPGFSGACWGYDFDWEARRANIPAYQPTVVATGIISNALFECWRITQNTKCKDLVVSSSNFVIKDLNKSKLSNNTFCYSYSPFDRQQVINASMKGLRILAQTYSITKEENLLHEAIRGIEYAINQQNNDGSFYYSDKGRWVDNYHTGYVLDCLHECIVHFKFNQFSLSLEKGLEYYINNLFTSEGDPKFYSNNRYPLDCTAASQSILTLTRFDKFELANKVAKNTIRQMQNSNGSFSFRKFKYYKIKTSFMRWSNAWMFAALTFNYYKSNTN